jgi:hypothetical protein
MKFNLLVTGYDSELTLTARSVAPEMDSSCSALCQIWLNQQFSTSNGPNIKCN